MPKDDPRVTAYGEVDETNATIGLAIAAIEDEETAEKLRRVQADLFTLGAELATPEGKNTQSPLGDERITNVEGWMDTVMSGLPALTNFVLPSGTGASAALHLARATCRRAERAVVTLARWQTVRPGVIIYLNRLSDLLFALARQANHQANVADTLWSA